MKRISFSAGMLCVVLSLCACNSVPSRLAEYPQDLTRAEVAAIPKEMIYVQSDSVLLEWAAMYPHELEVWSGIYRSLDDDGITPQQASRAVDLIIAWMKDTRPDGYRSSLGRRGDLIGAIERRDGLTNQQLRQLVDAMHGSELTIEPDNYNGTMRNFYVRYGSTWTLPFTTNMPHRMFWQLIEVRVDGERVEIENPHYHPEFVRFRLDMRGLAVGEHTIEARIKVGVTDWRSVHGFNRQESTPDDWPEMRARWQIEGTDTFTIEPGKAAAAGVR